MFYLISNNFNFPIYIQRVLEFENGLYEYQSEKQRL